MYNRCLCWGTALSFTQQITEDALFKLLHPQKLDRMMKKIASSASSKDPLTGCKIWTGKPTKNGYARTRTCDKEEKVPSTVFYVHRLVKKDSDRKTLLAGKDVSHLCHNRLCVNPKHLTVETRKQNNERKVCLKRGVCRGHGSRSRCLIAGLLRIKMLTVWV